MMLSLTEIENIERGLIVENSFVVSNEKLTVVRSRFELLTKVLMEQMCGESYMHQSLRKKAGLDIPNFGIVNMKILVKIIRLQIESENKEKRNGHKWEL